MAFWYTPSMGTPLSITASYTFVPIAEAELPRIKQELLEFGKKRKMQGLVLIATEGINATVAGSQEAIDEWKRELTKRFGEIVFKDSESQNMVFRRWSVKIKEEIVVLKDPRIHPTGKHKHLSPEEWQEMLAREDVVLVDTRNKYETAIGKFTGAIDPQIQSFQEFPDFVKSGKIAKDKKVMMYCTGGIRCEKALLEMEAEGYENVYQLEGGILAYLQKFPEKNFEGECFVFDHRVAVDQRLEPSKIYDLCPHCGDPGDLAITCKCGKNQKVCQECAKNPVQKTCSKRCANEERKKVTALVA